MEQGLSQYYIFYAVARHGNISRAAEELFISQPAISKGIHKLEGTLGTRLFKRNSRGVTLTEDGELLFQYVEEAFASLDTAEKLLERRQQLGISHLRVGASTTLCKYVLLPFLHATYFPSIGFVGEGTSSFHPRSDRQDWGGRTRWSGI